MKPATIRMYALSMNILAMSALVACVQAQEAAPVISGTTVFSSDVAPTVRNNAAGNRVVVTDATGSAASLKGTTSGAYRIQTTSRVGNIADSALVWGSTGTVSPNDRLQISFWYRSTTDNPVDKNLTVALVDRRHPYYQPTLRSLVYNPTTTWRKIQIGVKTWDSYNSGDLALEMWLGQDVQGFEIAGLQVDDLGSSFPEYALKNSVEYSGSSPNAPWRAQAQAQIAANRTGLINVRVVDGRGNPIAGAMVNAKMQKSAFEFGTAVNAGMMGNSLQSSNAYQNAFFSNFNAAVFENDTKWAQYINGWKEWNGENNPILPSTAGFLKDEGVHLRGHNLVWPTLGLLPQGYYYMPPDLDKSTPATTVRARTNAHIRSVLTDPLIANLFDEWDVLNEAYDNVDLQGTLAAGGKAATPGLLGNAEMASWYKQVNSLAPKAKTFYNNFSTIESDDVNRVAYDKALIRYIRANGGRVDGVGLQSHFTSFNASDPTTLSNKLQDWGSQNVRLKVTEYDMNADDPDGVANFLRDYLTVCYSNANVDGFYLWGFYANQMYQSRSALFNADWSPTPAGTVWKDLVGNKWKTNASVKTANDGSAALKGHLGTYKLSVTIGKRTAEATATLDKNGTTLTIVVP